VQVPPGNSDKGLNSARVGGDKNTIIRIAKLTDGAQSRFHKRVESRGIRFAAEISDVESFILVDFWHIFIPTSNVCTDEVEDSFQRRYKCLGDVIFSIQAHISDHVSQLNS
jgi:hypothetical protein